ncbi:MAG TPA: hypothetical protein VMQ67_08030 [Candidatus Saccharimonadales bacterium]|nr:hypothetical protein [Candidatus Saccharimonadales bacterium]
MENVVLLNNIDAAIPEPTQRALGIMLHTHDLWCKSGGKIDYRGRDGHARLFQDAMNFCGTGNPVATRVGDLSAAHLAIDWSDTQVRLAEKKMPPITDNVNDLIVMCRDLSELTVMDEKRIGLLLDALGKKPVR